MKLLYSLTFILLATIAFAQPGGLDKTYNADFGLNSKDLTPDSQTNLKAIGKQSDGSIVAFGQFAYSQFGNTWQIRRFKPDGNPDPAFTVTTFPGYSVSMVVQPDDKIVMVGTGGSGIVRLNPNGTEDLDFKTKIGTGATDAAGGVSSIWSLALDPDGKIYIGGFFEKFNGVTRIRIARLNSDGSVDTSFTPGEGATNAVSAIAFQSTGKIVIAGAFRKYDGSDRGGIARINTDGSIDASFNPVGFPDLAAPERILALPDDKLIIAGSVVNYDGVAANHYYVVKTNSDGVLDTNFLSPFQPGDGVVDAQIYDEDYIVVGGAFTVAAKHLAKMNINTGAFDPNFKPYSITGDIATMLVEEDGNIIIAGGITKVNGTLRNGLARVYANGNVEGGRGADNSINAIAEMGMGSVVVAGDFTGFRGIARNRVALVNAEGKLNDNLKPEQGANGAVLAMVKDASGKFIIAGNFTQYRGISRPRIARINDDGTLDDTFDPGLGANATVRTIAVQSNGMILIGGDFTSYDGSAYNHLIRLEADGDVDPTFEPDDGPDGNVQSIALQSDGKIIVAGSFNNFDNNSAKRIARISSLGAFDATFDPGTSADATIYVAKVDGDDNVFIGGGFTTFNGTTRKGVARLTVNGALDASFDAGDVDYNSVRTITLMTNGKVFIGGDFTNKVAMLNSDGETDTEWFPSVPPNGNVLASIEVDGKIIIGGQFTTYDYTGIDRLARINNEGKRAQQITFEPSGAFYAGTTAELSGTSTSGLPVTYTGDESMVTIDGNKVTFLHIGSVNIFANQEGDEDWEAAEPVYRTLTVLKGNQNVVFDVGLETPLTLEGDVGDEIDITSYAHTTSGLTPITYTSSAPGVASISDDGTKLILHSTGETFLHGTHPGNADFNAAYDDAATAHISVQVVITIPTGLEDEAALIVAYPNPTTGLLTIQLPSSHNGPARASLLNSLGQHMGNATQDGHNLRMDLSAHPQGIYFVKIQANGTNVVKRIQRK